MADFDPDEYLGIKKKDTEGGFDPDQYLADTAPAAEPSMPTGVGSAVTGAAFAVPMNAAAAIPAAQRIATAAVKPAMQSAAALMQAYRANPLGAVADAALLGTGNVPVFGPASALGQAKPFQGLYDRYIKPAGAAATEAKIMAGEGGERARQAYLDLKRSMPPAERKLMTSAYAGGGNIDTSKLVQSPQFQKVAGAIPEAAANAEKYLAAIPSRMEAAGKVLKPLAVGAARVAGPAMMAMDVNNAMEFAREQQLGQRLAQGQGRNAQQAFRNMNVQYGYQPTAQEAENLLASGAARDIQAFGGEDRLKRLIREEAAKRVVGPIAPR
jgi:hypothetical protein